MLITDATSLPRLMRCNGSRLMRAALPPDTDTERRDEGNAADWLAVQGFNGVALDTLCNTKAPNGWVVTADMIDHVSEYLKALDCGEVQAVTTFGTEQWEVRGRCDHRKWDAVPSILIIDDLKYGHRIVDAEGNWTLIAHAVGTCIELQIMPITIILRIHQPRPYHPDGKLREWRLTYPELMDHYAAINNTLSNPSDMLNTGSWCHYCPAEPTCPAARLAEYNSIDASELAYNDDVPVDVLNHRLDTIEIALQRLNASHAALTELAMHRITQGEPNQARAIEQRRGQTRFVSGLKPEFLSVVTGVDCTKPGIITPAEFLRRGGSQTSYDALTERPTTGKKLVRRSADEMARRVLGKE